MDITIKLTLEQWNAVLDMLSDQPVRKALAVIQAITTQAQAQMPAPNGADTAATLSQVTP